MQYPLVRQSILSEIKNLTSLGISFVSQGYYKRSMGSSDESLCCIPVSKHKRTIFNLFLLLRSEYQVALFQLCLTTSLVCWYSALLFLLDFIPYFEISAILHNTYWKASSPTASQWLTVCIHRKLSPTKQEKSSYCLITALDSKRSAISHTLDPGIRRL